ncbi:MAG: bifunctional 5,10-methylenetetrahydrofolate dehydrogenase/5,10-methenyltetrahydrofolate cyclohydrolase [Candidatus Schekmanbacteria bacterium]|nr:bifunctional 5,10-methylenetetrahydrofolate dehydrogenase/5,10-methenyltetrahydrofolate cyclohydrolase [Candidatus Schekmanbacteria bacterium]
MQEARRLDGKVAAAAFLAEVRGGVAAFRERTGRSPGLGALLVGEDPASAVYVRSKARQCEQVGIHSAVVTLGHHATTAEVGAAVLALNADAAIDGILVQLPLPPQVEKRAVLESVLPEKDVDGFHPLNAGRLVAGDRRALWPCTPHGIIRLLDREGIEIAGSRAVVLGRSDIVGKPLALLLLHRHATVTVCHSRTRNLSTVAREADILISAMGKPWLVDATFVRPGAAVVDVGMNRATAADFPGGAPLPESPWAVELAAKGYTLLGDVNPLAVAPVAGALTPVPGGVGPLTIAMLLHNTLIAARRRERLDAGEQA